jgi:hypothetical protein
VPHGISRPANRFLQPPFLCYYNSALSGAPLSLSIRYIPPSVSDIIQGKFFDLIVPASDGMEPRRQFCAETLSPYLHDDRQRTVELGKIWHWRPPVGTSRAILAPAFAASAAFRPASRVNELHNPQSHLPSIRRFK